MAGGPGVAHQPAAAASAGTVAPAGAEPLAATTVEAILSRQTSDALRTLALRSRTSPSIVTAAAFDLLLAWYGGRHDFLVGTVFGERPADRKDEIGFFVDTILLRARVDWQAPFSALLQQKKRAVLAAKEHSAIPLEAVMDLLRSGGQGRGHGHGIDPVEALGTVFMFRDVWLRGDELRGLRVVASDVPKTRSKFDLCLSVHPDPCYRLALETRAASYGPAFARDLVDAYALLLERVAAGGDPACRALPALAPGQRARVEELARPAAETTTTTTRPTTPPRQPSTITALFEAAVARHPERAALVAGDRRVSFAELDRAGNRIARALRRRRIGAGSVVAVCAERSLEMVELVVGILKAGAAYAPLDAGHPGLRLRQIVDELRPDLVVASPAAGTAAAGLDEAAATTALDALSTAAAAESSEPLAGEDAPTAASVAYVIHTSGSSGPPKGVLGLHGGMANRIAWTLRTNPYAPDEVACLKTSPAFVDSIAELFGPLAGGAPVLVLGDEIASSPLPLLRALDGGGVTRLVLVPSLLKVLLEAVERGAAWPARLRQVVSSGEALGAALAAAALRRVPGLRLFNLYGSSEVSADATAYEVPGEAALAGLARVPIGRPIDGVGVMILDEERRPRPPGTAGELWVTGVALAGGYHRRPELTHERFTKVALDGGAPIVAYRTGDLGRLLPDGNLDCLGRIRRAGEDPRRPHRARGD